MSMSHSSNEPIYMTCHITVKKQKIPLSFSCQQQPKHIRNPSFHYSLCKKNASNQKRLTFSIYHLLPTLFRRWREERNGRQCCLQICMLGKQRLFQSSSSHSCTIYQFAFTKHTTPHKLKPQQKNTEKSYIQTHNKNDKSLVIILAEE